MFNSILHVVALETEHPTRVSPRHHYQHHLGGGSEPLAIDAPHPEDADVGALPIQHRRHVLEAAVELEAQQRPVGFRETPTKWASRWSLVDAPTSHGLLDKRLVRLEPRRRVPQGAAILRHRREHHLPVAPQGRRDAH
eukprot:SAG22_NODE_8800_length_629_cov_0.854717_1_plen_138_part_10